ncbi:MAG: ATP-binding protein, partial [Rhodothermia bacterium]|nr:ATP-binding protein [Rhodothermia bacterium]
KPEVITEEIRKRLEKLVSNELRVTLWPHVSQDVPDTRELKLVLLGLEHTRQMGETEAFVREILEKCGQTFRTYRNTLLVLAADEGELAATRHLVKRLLAYRAIRDDRALWRQLSPENQRALESMLKDAEGGIVHRLMSAYRHLAKAGEQGVQWLDLGLPTVGMKRSLSHRVREYLRSEDLLLNKISPRYILEKAMGTENRRKPWTTSTRRFYGIRTCPCWRASRCCSTPLRRACGRRSLEYGSVTAPSSERTSYHSSERVRSSCVSRNSRLNRHQEREGEPPPWSVQRRALKKMAPLGLAPAHQ